MYVYIKKLFIFSFSLFFQKGESTMRGCQTLSKPTTYPLPTYFKFVVMHLSSLGYRWLCKWGMLYRGLKISFIAHVVIAHPCLLVWTTSERLLRTLVASNGSLVKLEQKVTYGGKSHSLVAHIGKCGWATSCRATCTMASHGEQNSRA